jgi:hypothetical protein
MLLGNVERSFTSPGILELLTRAIAGTEMRSRVVRGTIAERWLTVRNETQTRW